MLLCSRRPIHNKILAFDWFGIHLAEVLPDVSDSKMKYGTLSENISESSSSLGPTKPVISCTMMDHLGNTAVGLETERSP